MDMSTLQAQLAPFTGSEHYYRHPLFGMVHTDGVQHMADAAGAHWLIDVIYSHQLAPTIRGMEFQVWSIVVADEKAVISVTDGDGAKPIIVQEVEYTDFPTGTLELWFSDKTLYLPSEH